MAWVCPRYQSPCTKWSNFYFMPAHQVSYIRCALINDKNRLTWLSHVLLPPYCHDAEPTFLSILAHFSFLTDFKRKLTRDNILSVKGGRYQPPGRHKPGIRVVLIIQASLDPSHDMKTYILTCSINNLKGALPVCRSLFYVNL